MSHTQKCIRPSELKIVHRKRSNDDKTVKMQVMNDTFWIKSLILFAVLDNNNRSSNVNKKVCTKTAEVNGIGRYLLSTNYAQSGKKTLLYWDKT